MGTNDDREQSLAPESAANDTSLALIEEQADRTIRRVWHDDRWFFSVIDVIGVLTDSPNPGVYWRVLKLRLKEEGTHELCANCRQLKVPAPDGKLHATDCADFATLVALIHAMPALHRRATPSRSLTSSPDTCGCGIYAILNTITHERYIGSSRDMTSRFAQHKALLRRGKHHAPLLQEAWNTYGEDVFVFVVLEELSDTDQLEAVEQRYLDTEQPEYNGTTIAQNRLTLKPIAEERLQQLLLYLYDFQSADPSIQTPLSRRLREAIRYGVVKPGRNFQLLLAAEASGVETWEAFGAFLQQREQAG